MDFDYSTLFTIKLGTFFAGLLGATIALMKKSQGSILSRFGGYVSAIFAVLYVVPAIVDFIRHTTGYDFPEVAENILAFIFGMLANSMIENFLDDPSGTLARWIANVKRFKKSILSQTPIDFISITKDNNKNLGSDTSNSETSSEIKMNQSTEGSN